ncbi:activin receptor type-2A-like isoform X2 [Corticium candelabrum]|uniref:activin receptor type-2A-like isoform X2 n=1 Tax=Corticium candelabrum TaxID=121492 RepID=UPI002E271A97|nr:activin receptor type-2A-like isoform X2 [Corticium candelabrum]
MTALLLALFVLFCVSHSMKELNCSFYDQSCERNESVEGLDCSSNVRTCVFKQPICQIHFRVDADGSHIVWKKDCVDGSCCDVHCLDESLHLPTNSCVYVSEDSEDYYCCCASNMCNMKIGPPLWTPTVQSEQPTSHYIWPRLTSSMPSPSSGLFPADSKRKTIVIGIAGTISGAIIVIVVVLSAFSCWCWCRTWQEEEEPEHDNDKVKDLEFGGASELDGKTFLDHAAVDLSSLSLIEKIGAGRFSEVWKASLCEDLVAVKIFKEKHKRSWTAENDIYTKPEIKHHNVRAFIAARHQPSEHPGDYWIVFDFHEFGSLTDYLRANVLTLDEVCRMAGSIAGGLAYLHSEIPSSSGAKLAIAHRDMKSRNVLVMNDRTCCICDLGLSIKFQPGMSLTEAKAQVGTVRYMAPEVLEGAISFSRESFLMIDVYALGLVIWELLSRCIATGVVFEYKQPFEDEIGLQPTIKQMREVVVARRKRPKFVNRWDCDESLHCLMETVEECWDHDAEARLTAQCIKERINWCVKLKPTHTSQQETSETLESSTLRNDEIEAQSRGHTERRTEQVNNEQTVTME